MSLVSKRKELDEALKADMERTKGLASSIEAESTRILRKVTDAEPFATYVKVVQDGCVSIQHQGKEVIIPSSHLNLLAMTLHEYLKD